MPGSQRTLGSATLVSTASIFHYTEWRANGCSDNWIPPQHKRNVTGLMKDFTEKHSKTYVTCRQTLYPTLSKHVYSNVWSQPLFHDLMSRLRYDSSACRHDEHRASHLPSAPFTRCDQFQFRQVCNLSIPGQIKPFAETSTSRKLQQSRVKTCHSIKTILLQTTSYVNNADISEWTTQKSSSHCYRRMKHNFNCTCTKNSRLTVIMATAPLQHTPLPSFIEVTIIPHELLTSAQAMNDTLN